MRNMNHDAYSISSRRMSSGPLLKWTNLLRENFGTICGSSLSKQQIAMQCKSGFWQNQFENMSTTRPTYPCPWQFWVDKLRPSFFESKKSTNVESLAFWILRLLLYILQLLIQFQEFLNSVVLLTAWYTNYICFINNLKNSIQFIHQYVFEFC